MRQPEKFLLPAWPSRLPLALPVNRQFSLFDFTNAKGHKCRFYFSACQSSEKIRPFMQLRSSKLDSMVILPESGQSQRPVGLNSGSLVTTTCS
jgi:hypothetical protein